MRPKLFSILIFILVGLTFSLPPAAGAAEKVALKFASWKTGSGWYVYAAAMAKLIKDALPPGSTVDVLPHAGGVGNPTNVAAGKADLGLAFNVTANWAHQGIIAYKEPMKNLRGLVGGLDQYFLGIVTTNPKVKEVRDICEKKIPVNYVTVPRGGMGLFLTKMMIEAYGCTFDDIRKWGGSVAHISFGAIISRMKDGHADMWSHTVVAGHPAMTELAITKELHFMAIEDEPLKKLMAQGITRYVIPKGTFRGVDRDIQTAGLGTNVIATEGMSEEVAYIITKTLCEKYKDLQAAHKGLAKFVPETMAWKSEEVGVPLHEGALRYYKEKGWIK